MQNVLKIVVITLYICLFPFSAFSQINLNNVKNKAKEKANDLLIKKEKPNKNTKGSEKEINTHPTKENTQPAEKIDGQNNENEEKAPTKYTTYQKVIPPPIQKDKYGRNVGEILFSKKPIKYAKEDKSLITNEFIAGDEVFGMAYLADTKINLKFEQGYKIWIHDAEDGRGYNCVYDFNRFEYKPNQDGTNNGDQKFYDLDVLATKENAWDIDLAKHILQFMSLYIKGAKINDYVAKRIHRFEVQLSSAGYLVAKGEFYYDLTNNSERVLKMYDDYIKADLKNFYLPVSKRNDPVLGEKIKQVMVKEGVNVQKIVFSTNEWGMIRHELSGRVLKRSIWAYVVYKNEKGECHYDDVQFTEDFIGNAFSGIIKKAGYGTANGQILCENIK